MLTVGFKAPHVQDGSKRPFYIYDPDLVGHLYDNITMPPPALGDASFHEFNCWSNGWETQPYPLEVAT